MRLPKTNASFKVGFTLNMIEGLLSGSNFMVIYVVLQSLERGSLDMKSLVVATAALAGILALRLVLYGTGYVRFQMGGAAVSRTIRLLLGDKLKAIPLSRFTQEHTGRYINTLTTEVNSYEKILTHKVGDLAKNITLSAMLILFVTGIWFPAGMILLLLEVLLVPTIMLSSSLVKKYGQRKNRIHADAVSDMVEYIDGIQTFRAYGRAGAENENVIASMKRFSDISYSYEVKLLPVGVIYMILNWCGLPLIMQGAFDPWLAGSLSTVSYLIMCLMPLYLSKLAWTLLVDSVSYKNSTIAKDHILEVMTIQEEVSHAAEFAPRHHAVVFEKVRFSYAPGEEVLKAVDFVAEDQKLTAIVGDSGSGKSTILNVISKYYEVDSGRILIGGQPIQSVSAEQVLKHLSLVDQDVFLFNDSIRNNVRHARPSATDAEVEAACTEAGCSDLIQTLPHGYDAPVGENGNRLSGGERQRISIARAILKDSPLILLDEATASLDIENELAVRQAIVNLLKNRKTVLMVAHTLSIIKNADKILVIDKGEIAEAGKHEQLLAQNGKYAAMWHAEQSLLN